jgi:hypothetical protein
MEARFSDTPYGKALLKMKDIYFKGRHLVLHDGSIVRFWKDPWLDNEVYVIATLSCLIFVMIRI